VDESDIKRKDRLGAFFVVKHESLNADTRYIECSQASGRAAAASSAATHCYRDARTCGIKASADSAEWRAATYRRIISNRTVNHDGESGWSGLSFWG
jgi:hypothetical protein